MNKITFITTIQKITDEQAAVLGKKLLTEGNPIIDELEILGLNFENSKRKTVYKKVLRAYRVFEDLVIYYGTTTLIDWSKKQGFKSFNEIITGIPSKSNRNSWINLGGQLMPETELATLKNKINTNKIKSWDEVHDFYETMGNKYPEQKFQHAVAVLSERIGKPTKKITPQELNTLLDSVVQTKEWMSKGIHDSKAKDFANPYRQMVYDSTEEMDAVVGKLADNSFINDQVVALAKFKKNIAAFKKQIK